VSCVQKNQQRKGNKEKLLRGLGIKAGNNMGAVAAKKKAWTEIKRNKADVGHVIGGLMARKSNRLTQFD